MANKFPPQARMPQQAPGSVGGPPPRVGRSFDAADAGGQMLKEAMRDQTVERMRKSMKGPSNGGRGR